MRPLGILVLVLLAVVSLAPVASADPFGPPIELAQESVPRVEVASTTAGPLAVWLEDGGAVKANGHVVTSGAVRIAVATEGEFALVVWTRADGSVMAMRRRADGTSAGIVRKIGSNASGSVAIAAAAGRYFVAWAGSLGEIYAGVVSTLGVPLVPAMPVTTQSPSAGIMEVAAAASANGFAAVWHDLAARKVFAVTLDARGVPVSMEPLLLAEEAGFPDVASDGEGFFVTWGLGTIYARTLTVDRVLGRVRTVTSGAAPRVAWDGFAYGMVFVREVRPRPGTVFYQLAALRISEYGTFVESLSPANAVIPRSYDIDARMARLDIGYAASGGAWVQSATVRDPRTRVRALRH